MIGGVFHIRRAEEGERFAGSRLEEREGDTDDGPARGDRDWRGLRVHVDEVLVDPPRVRYDEQGDAVDDVLAVAIGFGGLANDERTSIADRFGKSLSEPTE